MISLNLGLVLTFIFTAAVLVIVALYGSRATKAESFMSHFLADRNIGPIVIALTMAASLMSAFILVGLTGFFYTHGAGSWHYVGIGNTLVVAAVAFFGYPLWKISIKYNYSTPLEFLKDRYSKGVAILAALVTVIFLTPYMAVQFQGVGKLVETLTNGEVSYLFTITLCMVLVVVTTQLGGMRTVAWTDAIQGAFFFAVAIILAFVFLKMEFGGSLTQLFNRVADVEPALLSIPGPKGLFTRGMIISFYIMVIFMPVSQMQLTQRYMVLRDKNTFRGLLIGTAVLPFIVVLAPMIFGLGGKVLFPELSSGDLAYASILTRCFSTPVIIIGAMGVFCACLTTINSQVLVIGSNIGRDLYDNIVTKQHSEATTLLISKIGMLIVTLIVFAFSIKPAPLIVQLAIVSYSYTLQLVPTMIGALYWKRGNSYGALTSIIAGIGLMLLHQFKIITLSKIVDHSTWGLLLGIVVYIVVSLLTQPPGERATQIVDHVKGFTSKA